MTTITITVHLSHEVKGLSAAYMTKPNVNKQKKTFDQQTKGTRKSNE